MDIDVNQNNVLTKKYKLFLTFIIYLCYLVYASNFYITGPSLLDLKRIYRTSYVEISNVNTIRSFAYTFGALNGFVFQFINKQLGFMTCLLVIALTMALTPHLGSINLLFVCFAINGFACGGIESSADVWIVEMWSHECGPYVQALHFVFGVGSIITPLVVEPFLSEQNEMEIEINGTAIEYYNKTELNETNNYSLDILSSEDIFRSQVYIPYTFLAIIIAICGLIIGSLYYFNRYTPPQRVGKQKQPKLDESIHNSKESSILENLNQTFIDQLMPTKQILLMVVLCGYLMSIFLSLEWSQFNYFPSFAHFSDLHLSEKRAAIISTGLAISFTVGRAISIPLSHYLSPKLLIYGALILLLVSEFLFLAFSNTSETFMWIANIIFGLGLSPIYASIYHMVEEVTPVTNLMGVLFIFMSGLTSALTPIILGFYIESQPLVLIYVNLICVLISIVLIVAIHLVISKLINTNKNQNNCINNNNIENNIQIESQM